MSILRSKLTVVASGAALLLFGSLFWRTYEKQRSLQAEIRELKNSITSVETKNRELANLVEFFSKPEHLDKEARSRLNLKGADEDVLVVPPMPRVITSTRPSVIPTQAPSRVMQILKGLFELEKHY